MYTGVHLFLLNVQETWLDFSLFIAVFHLVSQACNIFNSLWTMADASMWFSLAAIIAVSSALVANVILATNGMSEV